MNAVFVRQAVLADIDALAPIFDSYRQFYGRPTDLNAAREFLLTRFTNTESVLFIAYEAGAAIGFAQLYPSFSSVSLARIYILNDIFVRQQSRRKGAANILLKAAVDYGKASGAVRLTLSTAITNESAQALYETAGWKRDQKFFVYHYNV